MNSSNSTALNHQKEKANDPDHSKSSISTFWTPLFRKVQHWSGIAFSVFTSIHVATTISAALSPQVYDQVLESTRAWYRPSKAVEGVVVMSPLMVHLMANSYFFCLNYFPSKSLATKSLENGNSKTTTTTTTVKTASVSIWKRLHQYAGYALFLLIPGHIYGVRFAKAYDQEFATLRHLLEKVVGPWVGMSYFGILMTAGVYHMLFGLNTALGYKVKRPFVLSTIVAVLAAAYFGLLGIGGFLYPVESMREKFHKFD
ncbi:hypothetical protein FDP41_003301 [Naegleria fowleri]|uniref:Mitochondrial adapter protein MCP1 transmembrane domain-containing protein n=1 Tax=Naegleria fowleri TaxID=5763 RepID=A0A6A5BYG6_NAEFO|nr:uncharacterized protein FDP41_003301 [Naegleria fowleri]KAF0977979.1 hypothetical protein FDP41_003301 [Naegleria fowleri]CAG4714714.1 unnamed protein product [Naegleria fowleri]